MGQIADDMNKGKCCDLCGCYFRERSKQLTFSHNHPATCDDCWKELTEEEKKFHKRCDGDIVTF